MPSWEIILRAPPLLITALSVVAYIDYHPPRVFNDGFGTLSVGALTVGSVISAASIMVWSYALYVAASKRAPP